MQEKELEKNIEELIEIEDMEVEAQSQNQDVDLMLSTQQGTVQSPPPLVAVLALSEEDEIIPLDDNMVMDTYIFSYDELHKKIVKAQTKHSLDDLASLAFMRERVIVENTNKDPNSIAQTTWPSQGKKSQTLSI